MSIETVFREWQRELRLQDWNLQYGLRSAIEMGSDHGAVKVHAHKQCAFIRLRESGEGLPADELEPYDPEIAMVHEMLHCRLHAFMSECGTFENDVQEQAVHVISTVLVAMKKRVRELETQAKRRRKA